MKEFLSAYISSPERSVPLLVKSADQQSNSSETKLLPSFPPTTSVRSLYTLRVTKCLGPLQGSHLHVPMLKE